VVDVRLLRELARLARPKGRGCGIFSAAATNGVFIPVVTAAKDYACKA